MSYEGNSVHSTKWCADVFYLFFSDTGDDTNIFSIRTPMYRYLLVSCFVQGFVRNYLHHGRTQGAGQGRAVASPLGFCLKISLKIKVKKKNFWYQQYNIQPLKNVWGLRFIYSLAEQQAELPGSATDESFFGRRHFAVTTTLLNLAGPHRVSLWSLIGLFGGNILLSVFLGVF